MGDVNDRDGGGHNSRGTTVNLVWFCRGGVSINGKQREGGLCWCLVAVK